VTDVRLLHRTELIAEHLVFPEVQRRRIEAGCLAGAQPRTTAPALGRLPQMIAATSQRRLGLSLTARLGRLCIHVILRAMSTYLVTQDGPVFEVRLGDASGRVVATFSNRLAAERFAEQQQARDDSARNHPTDGVSR
jgi:hypothetical protein